VVTVVICRLAITQSNNFIKIRARDSEISLDACFLPMTIFISFNTNARWKFREVIPIEENGRRETERLFRLNCGEKIVETSRRKSEDELQKSFIIEEQTTTRRKAPGDIDKRPEFCSDVKLIDH